MQGGIGDEGPGRGGRLRGDSLVAAVEVEDVVNHVGCFCAAAVGLAQNRTSSRWLQLATSGNALLRRSHDIMAGAQISGECTKPLPGLVPRYGVRSTYP